MADKLRRTQPITITLGEGEQPSAAKLTAIPNQARTGSYILEKAIGDLWNQSGDAQLGSYPLQISNLARCIGAGATMNPALHYVDQDFLFSEEILGSDVNSGYFKFRPASAAVTFSGTGNGKFTTLMGSKELVVATTQFHVDTTTGEWFTFDTIESADSITAQYVVDISTWVKDDRILPGVIPDPRHATNEFTACRIEDSGSYFLIHLPPRRPLVFTAPDVRPGSYPSSVQDADAANNAGTATATPQTSFWQQYVDVNTLAVTGSAGGNQKFYRYSLPQELVTILGSLTPGDALPSGFLLLWDISARTIVDDAIFSKDGDDLYTLRVTSVSADATLTTNSTADEKASSYNSGGYAIITSGSPVARRLDNLERRMEGHTHTPNDNFTQPVDHEKTINVVPDDSSAIGGAWPISQRGSDPHTNLLDRLGSRVTRDQWKGAMLGPIIMANADVPSGTDYINGALPDNSFEIFFGDTTGPYIKGIPGGVQVGTDLSVDGGLTLDADGDVMTLRTIKVTPTPNQIQNMFSTAIELIPAPGSGKMIVVDKFFSKMDDGGTAYDHANDTILGLKYGTGTSISSSAAWGSMINKSFKGIYDHEDDFLTTLKPATYTSVENQALNVVTDKVGTAVGTSDIDFILTYWIIDV